jgi:hypothetical protein
MMIERQNRFLCSLLLLLAFFALTVTGCSAAGSEPGAEQMEATPGDAAEAGDGPGLVTMAPTALMVQPSATPAANSPPGENAVERIEEGDVVEEERIEAELVESDVVTPVVVDLRDITPEPPGEHEEPREMPQPGIPKPSVAATNKAVVDLADHLGIDVSEVQVISVEQVEWPDSSLGCPKQGLNYLMVITPGFRIILEANGNQVAYHADMHGHIVRCAGDVSGSGGGVER